MNIWSKFSTLDTSQLWMCELKYVQSLNIIDISVTWLVSQLPICEFQAVSPMNMPLMFVADPVFHLFRPMLLNWAQCANISSKSVTAPVFQWSSTSVPPVAWRSASPERPWLIAVYLNVRFIEVTLDTSQLLTPAKFLSMCSAHPKTRPDL